MNPPLKVIPGMYWFAGTGPDANIASPALMDRNAGAKARPWQDTHRGWCALVLKTRKRPPKLDKLTPACRYWAPRKDSRYG